MTDLSEQAVDLDEVLGDGPAAPATEAWMRWMSSSLPGWPGKPARAGCS
jgi:hypothetical protein